MHDAQTASHPHAWFADILAGIRRRRRRHAEYRRVLNELMTLSARDLADLDIARADFRRIASDAARSV